MPQNKKILAVSFEGPRPAQGAAMWDGKELYVKEIREIGVEAYAWIQTLMEDIEVKSGLGWVVMVEDRTASFASPATTWNFDSVGTDGRTNLQSALDWYFALNSRGQIFMEDRLARYKIGMGTGDQDMVYRKNDEKGRMRYEINWQQFTCGHRALLMCVAGAAMEEPLSERWIKTFTGKLPERKKPNIWPVISTMKNYWASEQQRIEKAREEIEARKSVQH